MTGFRTCGWVDRPDGLDCGTLVQFFRIRISVMIQSESNSITCGGGLLALTALALTP